MEKLDADLHYKMRSIDEEFFVKKQPQVTGNLTL